MDKRDPTSEIPVPEAAPPAADSAAPCSKPHEVSNSQFASALGRVLVPQPDGSEREILMFEEGDSCAEIYLRLFGEVYVLTRRVLAPGERRAAEGPETPR